MQHIGCSKNDSLQTTHFHHCLDDVLCNYSLNLHSGRVNLDYFCFAMSSMINMNYSFSSLFVNL